MDLPKKEYVWLLLPIDNSVREFNAKLLLAVVAVEHGWGVIIAPKSIIRHDSSNIGGVVIEINMENEGRVDRHLSLGRRVCAWDEEGLIYLNSDLYCQRRLVKTAIRKMDFVFLWGENQFKDITKRIKGIENKLILTGNPRFDLLRPDLREFYSSGASLLRSKFGKYILINTSFGFVNHYFGKDYTLRNLLENEKVTTERQELDQIAGEKHQERIMQAFLAMLPMISTHFHEHKIIIRPHPSENFDTWRSAAKELPNVSMIHDGDANPWLLGADVIIHNSCTTGVQAFLLGKPVIAYMPFQSDKYDQFLPNALSYRAEDIEQLFTLIRKLTSNASFGNQELEQEKKLIAQKYIMGLEGPWVSDRIMDELEKLELNPKTLDPDTFYISSKNIKQHISIVKRLTNLFKSYNERFSLSKSKRSLQEKNWSTYTRQRIPSLSLKEIQADLGKLQKITGRFSNTSVCIFKDEIVCIFPAKE